MCIHGDIHIQCHMFQYRKRYEVTCDKLTGSKSPVRYSFQYRKRYEVTCDLRLLETIRYCLRSFNTASGMRSHVTIAVLPFSSTTSSSFNTASGMRSHVTSLAILGSINSFRGFNTASGMRSHVTWQNSCPQQQSAQFQYRKRYEVTCDVPCL